MRYCIQHTTYLFRLIFSIACFIAPALAKSQCGGIIATFPYHEDFESAQGGWNAGGVGNDWAWGTPAKPTINMAGAGMRCWVTGGLSGSFYSFGERSYVTSPCFDFTGLAHPYIHFLVWWESERQYDGANLQYSLDNGATWTNVGSANDPPDCLTTNWYNTSSITNLNTIANPRHGWAGNIQPTTGNCQGGSGSGGWVSASHCLSNLAGKPSVQFRFAFGAGTACNDFDGFAFDEVSIENAPLIAADFRQDCAGVNTLSFTDLSSNCPDAWHWDFGDPASGALNSSTQQNPTHIFSGSGVFTVTLQVSSTCSGTSSIVYPVEILGLQTSVTPPSCYGGHDGSISIQSTPAGNAVYTWGTIPPQSGPTLAHLSAGDYKVTVNQPGFCPVSTTITLTQPDSLTAPAYNSIQAIGDTSIALGAIVTLSGWVNDPGRIVSYVWKPATDLECDTCLQTLASPLQTTRYILMAADTNGCVISDALTVQVAMGSVYIPNVFRPDSGDPNAHFTAYAARDVERIDWMRVYDRWGSLVFERREFSPSDAVSGWDGTIDGKDAPAGVYVYALQLRFLNGASAQYKGNVTLLR